MDLVALSGGRLLGSGRAEPAPTLLVKVHSVGDVPHSPHEVPAAELSAQSWSLSMLAVSPSQAHRDRPEGVEGVAVSR